MRASDSGSARVDAYVAGFPEAVQAHLRVVRETIRKAAPEAEEAIAYGIPTFKLGGNLVHFAAFKQHVGLYPGAAAIEAFRDDLAAYVTSKGAIRFPIDGRMPTALIRRIVKHRVLAVRGTT